MFRYFLCKKTLILVLIISLIASPFSYAFAADTPVVSSDVKLIINGETINPDVSPQIINDRVFLPVRWVAEPLGATVEWDDKKRAVLVDSSSNQIDELIDNTIRLFVAGKQIEPDVKPQIINSRVMVPIRWVAEALGAEVAWDGKSRTVTITKDKERYGFERVIKKEGKVVATFEPDELYIATSSNRIYQYSPAGTDKLIGKYIRELFPDLKFKIIDWDYARQDDWVANGVYPDIYIATTGSTSSLMNTYGMTYDITPFIEKYNLDTDRLNKSAMSATLRAGRGAIYSLPIEINDYILYYNKKYFDMRDEPYPHFGMTYDEAYEKAKIMTFQSGFSQIKGWAQHPDVYLGSNQRCLSPYSKTDPNKVVLLTDEYIDVVNNLRRFYTIPGNIWNTVDDFSKFGVVSMCVDSLEKLHYLATVKEYLEEDDYQWWTTNKDYNGGTVFSVPSNWDISTIPVFDDTPNTIYTTGGLACFISKQSQMKETAFQIVAKLLTDEAQKGRAADGIKGTVKTDEIAAAFGSNVPEYKNLNLSAVYWGENAYRPVDPAELSNQPQYSVNLWLVFRKYIFQYGMSTENALKRTEDEENERIQNEIKASQESLNE